MAMEDAENPEESAIYSFTCIYDTLRLGALLQSYTNINHNKIYTPGYLQLLRTIISADNSFLLWQVLQLGCKRRETLAARLPKRISWPCLLHELNWGLFPAGRFKSVALIEQKVYISGEMYMRKRSEKKSCFY